MRRNTDEGVFIQGLSDMQRVLKKVQSDLEPELRKRLRATGEGIVAPRARRYAPVGVRSAQYRFGGRTLAESVKVSVTRSGASVYSTAEHGGVQNFGGRVGRNRATLLRRSDVSQYMTRAVRDTRRQTTDHIEGTLDWLARELGS